MEEENNRSSGALQEAVHERSKPVNEEDEKNRGKEMKKIDEQGQVNNNSGCTVDHTSTGERGESAAYRLKTLASVPLSKGDLQFAESSHLSEVPVEYSLQPLQSVKEVKDQVKEVHEEPSICSSDPTAQLQIQHQMQVPDTASRLELSPTSITQSMSSISSPSQLERKLQQVTNGNKSCVTDEGKQNSPLPKLSSVPMPKTPSNGYNWRKYGQKQVKSPEGSRSYYRCTFSDCYAKKIECSDRSNRVTETIYRSHHNHDPPQKLNCNRENRLAIPIATVSGSTDATHPVSGVNELVPLKEPLPGISKMPGAKQQESNGSHESTEVNAKDEYADGPEYKRRKKIISPDELESLPRPENKPKFVVHAAGDVGISGDGYRWRKYGQKMVKGKSHPRNYYRCTSAGCPVRKHIERAVDSTSALIITYRGGHNHDMPVPRKCQGPKSAPPISGTSGSGDKSQINKSETSQSQMQCSTEKEGKSTGEPTRTLLSIGFEIKPC